MRVANEKERDFYAEECAKSAWSVRQLERQIHTMYYQRILASQDKSLVAAEIQTTEPKPEYEKIIKDPYVMEFLQIQPDTHVYEGELEQALIDHLQHFLLELGRGFSFVARQKKFTLDGQNFFIDLVFYNYILKCFVLIDLKMGQLTHQDLGQMQMYVNYYTRELMNEGDTPPIGIVLCADKSDAVVKYTLPEDNHQIFASKYFTYLPTEEELKRVAEIVEKHNLWLISDEIHCDIIRNGRKHIPMGKVMPDYGKLITCMSASKTFNMAGLMFSDIIIRDTQLRKIFCKRDKIVGFINPLSVAAHQAAYEKCDEWLAEFKTYLDENFIFVKEYLAEHLPAAVFSVPEATYLAWVNLKGCLPDVVDLPGFFANNAGVLLEGGNDLFVGNAEGYVRLNLAMPRSIIKTGLERMTEAIEKHNK
mgnify:CR=1 FL=1